jgi:hypothetical protein
VTVSPVSTSIAGGPNVSKPTSTVGPGAITCWADATGAAAQATAPVRAMQKKARGLNWP